MKITTIVLASALAMPSSFAFAQAGEGDANFTANSSGGGYGGPGYSGGFGAYPRWQSYAWEPESRYPRLAPEHRRWAPYRRAYR